VHPFMEKPEPLSFLPGIGLKLQPHFDLKPENRTKFHLYINGAWTLVYEAPMLEVDWNTDTD
jgi:hypothetical protein